MRRHSIATPAAKMPKSSRDGVTARITDVLKGKDAEQFEAIRQSLHSLI